MDNLALKTVNPLKRTFWRSAAAAAASVGAVLITTTTHALTAADITTATSANDSSSLIDTAAIWILGVVVGIFAVRKVIGFFGK